MALAMPDVLPVVHRQHLDRARAPNARGRAMNAEEMTPEKAREHLRSLNDEEFYHDWRLLDDERRSDLGAEFVTRFARISAYKPVKLNGSGRAPEDVPPVIDRIAQAEASVERSIPRNLPVRVNWSALDGRTLPAREWAIEHWLGFHLTLIAGRGGIGKTLLAQMLGTALSNGLDFLDRTPRPLRALLWACEDDHDELWRRQLAINDFFSIGMDAIDGKFIAESRIGCENVLFSVEYGRALWTPVYEELRQQANDERIDVLFLDNIGQTYAGNKADEHMVTHYGNGLSGLVSGRPFCPALLGHPARALGSEFSGAAAWENVARMRLYLGENLPDAKEEERDPTSNVRYLAKRKQNYTAKDYRRFTYQNGVLVPDAPEIVGAPGIVESIRRRNAEQAVLEAVPWLAERGLAGSHTHTARDKYLPKLMAAHKIHRGFTGTELAEAITRLIGEKRLLVDQEFGRNKDRKVVYGLKVPDSPR
jgi:hypothetical protein